LHAGPVPRAKMGARFPRPRILLYSIGLRLAAPAKSRACGHLGARRPGAMLPIGNMGSGFRRRDAI